MQALVWTAPEKMEMQEQPEPTPTASEVVIRVAYAGICGSELSGFLGHNALRTPPLVMGHEFFFKVVKKVRLGFRVEGKTRFIQKEYEIFVISPKLLIPCKKREKPHKTTRSSSQ